MLQVGGSYLYFLIYSFLMVVEGVFFFLGGGD